MRIEVNGVSLFFDIEGAKFVPDGPIMREKPTLILLHGAPGLSDHSSFKPLFGSLSDVAQIIYLDLRGCGRSDAGPAHLWTLHQWADDLRVFCDALDIQRPVVLGQSGGGFVAIAFGARHNRHAGKLVLASTQARVLPQRIIDVVLRRASPAAGTAAKRWLAQPGDAQAFKGWRDHGLPLYNHEPQDPNGAKRTIFQMDTWGSFAQMWYREGPDLLPEMAGISCPTLILTGDDDPICPTEDADDMLAALRTGIGRLERFEHCGHGVWRDHPDRALQVLREFILS